MIDLRFPDFPRFDRQQEIHPAIRIGRQQRFGIITE
jgi:hypothetical protein